MPLNMISADFIIEKKSNQKKTISIDKNKCCVQDQFSETLQSCWRVRICNGIKEEIHFNDKSVMWSRSSEESSRIPVQLFSTETAVVNALWTSFYLPEKYGDEFEVEHIHYRFALLAFRIIKCIVFHILGYP